MSIILKQNDLPDSFRNKIAAPEGLKDIDAKDWLTLGKKLGFRYQNEEQFRSLFVIPFLSSFATAVPIYKECACKRQDLHSPSFVDNILLFGDKCFCVEVKQSIRAERDLEGQCHKYTHLESAELTKDKKKPLNGSELYEDNVLIIDMEGIYYILIPQKLSKESFHYQK